jgi:hypothetical protein
MGSLRASRSRHLAVLQWARANGCDWSRTCISAAQGGHLAVLQWERANGCEWDSRTCSKAAKGGHLTVLQWARGNGCDWDSRTCSKAAQGASSNGRERMDVIGVVPVSQQLKVGISPASNG